MRGAGDQPPELPGVRHRWVQARGARFHVAEAGEQGAPAVVLLHGWPQHWYEWRGALPALAQAGMHVIAPDLRGFGWSEATPRGYRKPALARDVLAVLDAMGVGRFALAGHDWGGYVAFLLGLHEPERVSRLVLVNTGHGFPRRDLRTLRAQAGFWYMPLLGTPVLGPALVRSGLIKAAFRRAPDTAAWSPDELDVFLDRIDPHVTQQVYGSFVFGEVLPAMLHPDPRRLRMPTLFLHGDADSAIRPDFIRGLEDHADDYRLELLPGLGHFCIEEAPEVVLPKLVGFLAG
ncbi:alpha/beta hydrolase [Baekduia soli]|uniref:Alpha/beta hydrolase n=1 Tax=Baekduia soli TaxID=496014 RepID=A0A5B8U4Y8_9ACTN|nr:alpha/beta hydrolase [Baekduia soli]QEC48133.1 alpha/beta hydrolase [Baekduia soli]